MVCFMYVIQNILHKGNNIDDNNNNNLLLFLFLLLYCDAVISKNVFGIEEGNVVFACCQSFM